jgi:hypothetical protein
MMFCNELLLIVCSTIFLMVVDKILVVLNA